MPYTLQLLHYYGESGTLANQTAPILGALVDKFDDQYPNTIKIGEGDTFIPGPWLIGGADPSLSAVSGIGSTALGRPDVAIFNALGTTASALGNHEFDLGSPVLQSAIQAATPWVGAQFPFITDNLNFSADSSLKGLADNSIGGTGGAIAGSDVSAIKGKIAPYAITTINGQKIGFVGSTTFELLSKTSPNGTVPYDDNPNAVDANDLQEVATKIQNAVDALTAMGVNKIVQMDQLDDISRTIAVSQLVSGVDIWVAGGGHERLADSTDTLSGFNGHTADAFPGLTYPVSTTGKDGKAALVVTTDTEFTYLGRLVVTFDDNGIIDPTSLNPAINGAYASTEATLQAAYVTTQTANQIIASSTIGSKVKAITDAVNNVITTKDGTIWGYTKVYLEGDRAFGRVQEVNLGDITADANLYAAQQALGSSSSGFITSLKNGGGIRASIGSIDKDGGKIPPIANPSVNKPKGAISTLDIENALRFDNKLMVFDTTPQGLKNIMEFAAGLSSGPTNQNGGYMQIGGIRVSYNSSRPAGSRVQSIALTDLNGNVTQTVYGNGVFYPTAPATIQIVTLNFTANGGDGYPIKDNANNFRYLLANGKLSAAVNKSLDFTTTATFATVGLTTNDILGEQKAFETYLQAFYGTPATAYGVADTSVAQDQRIQQLSFRSDTVLDTTLRQNSSNDVFKLPGNDSMGSSLKVTVQIKSNSISEVGVFAVDNASGSINGIAPGSAGYEKLVLDQIGKGKGGVIVSNLGIVPDGFTRSTTDLTRILRFSPDQTIRFYSITTGTTTDDAANGVGSFQFSPVQKVQNLGNGQFSLDFNNLTLTVTGTTTTNAPLPLGTGLQGKKEGETFDLRGITGTVQATFTVNREAAYNNFVGFYKVDDETGRIGNLKPTDEGYARAAVQNRVAGIDLQVANQGTATLTGQLTGGSIFAPFLIVNGTADQFLSGQATQAFFNYVGANSDKVDHVRLLGNNIFGFEDLVGGGDRDFNDVIVKAQLTA